jgi:archaellum component FlaC
MNNKDEILYEMRQIFSEEMGRFSRSILQQVSEELGTFSKQIRRGINNEIQIVKEEMQQLGSQIYAVSQETRRNSVLLEELTSDFHAITEILIDTHKQVQHIPKMQEDISDIRQELRTMTFALTDTNRQAHNHEHRITRLEAA